MKACSCCGLDKDEAEFAERRGECRSCRNVKRVAWRRLRPPTKAQHHKYYLKNRYGIVPEDYDAMFVAQSGVCLICDSPPSDVPLRIDHDHATGQVRGLLCHACNLALGLLGDDPARMVRAAEYVKHWRTD